MRAVVLVGGFGTRLRPLTLTSPKQMLPVAGRPMIEDVLAHLRHHGVDEVVLSLGYKPDAFLEAYPDATCAGVRLVYVVEPEPLDTAGAIAFAAREAGIDERFLVVNGDVLTDLDVSALVAFHEAAGAEGTIALTQVEDPSQFGVVPTEPDGRVIAFVEKPPRDEAPTDLINAGYYVLEPSVLDRIPGGRKVNIERETFPAMVADGRLFAVADPGYWLDVGTPERLLQASLDLLTGVRPGGPGGDVLLVGDATVDDGAEVARSVLGDGCRVAAGAVVTDAVLLSGVVVEAGAVVRRSVVGAGAVVSAGSVVTDLSVLGDCARTEPGATLSGVRLPDPEQP
ncbi:MAG: Mannose-phosphate guanylyltransferase [Actinomycetia bacterium]|nr:Mannose-phosphate guanylyltransferase [Actinomycetes bacterium]